MAIESVHTWGSNEQLTSAQISAISASLTFAVDKRSGKEDTIGSILTVVTNGRIVIDHGATILIQDGGQFIGATDANFQWDGAAQFGGLTHFGDAVVFADSANFQGGVVISGDVLSAGAVTLLAKLTVKSGRIQWESTNPVSFDHVDRTDPHAIGVSTAFLGQNATGATSTGGNLILGSGSGTLRNGQVNIKAGATTRATFADEGTFIAGPVEFTGETHSFPFSVPFDASNVVLDFSKSNHIEVGVLTASTTFSFINAKPGGIYTVEVQQDATGGRSLAWSGNVFFGGVVSAPDPGPGKRSIWEFKSKGPAGLFALVRNSYA